MPDQLKVVIASILDVSADDVGEDASPDRLSSWDSVRQIDLMLAVEDEFNVRFDDREVATLTSYAAIRDAVLARGVALT